MSKNQKTPKFLSVEELEALSTKRLMAYKNRLYKVVEGPDDDAYKPGQGRMNKQNQDWKGALRAVKKVLATREHLDDSRRGSTK